MPLTTNRSLESLHPASQSLTDTAVSKTEKGRSYHVSHFELHTRHSRFLPNRCRIVEGGCYLNGSVSRHLQSYLCAKHKIESIHNCLKGRKTANIYILIAFH
eukprot:GFKZ01002299.1.p1 GENE.GFKZ01002299.1~~GFKZ01002299.1.p1  ORF type:complete len:102 (-),score=0.16 GFKZ01002299.1:70-375(-)